MPSLNKFEIKKSKTHKTSRTQTPTHSKPHARQTPTRYQSSSSSPFAQSSACSALLVAAIRSTRHFGPRHFALLALNQVVLGQVATDANQSSPPRHFAQSSSCSWTESLLPSLRRSYKRKWWVCFGSHCFRVVLGPIAAALITSVSLYEIISKSSIMDFLGLFRVWNFFFLWF